MQQCAAMETTFTSTRQGWRGYIGSRPYHRELPPQSIQNLVVRDYCQRHGKAYLLSVTEYAMPDSYLMLHEVLREADRLEGLVLYSIFMLPVDRNDRHEFVVTLLQQGLTLHGAAENVAIRSMMEWQVVDDMLMLHYALEG